MRTRSGASYGRKLKLQFDKLYKACQSPRLTTSSKREYNAAALGQQPLRIIYGSWTSPTKEGNEQNSIPTDNAVLEEDARAAAANGRVRT
jgi:hypothetical protein